MWKRIKSQVTIILRSLKHARVAHGTYSCTSENPALQRHVELVELQSHFKPAISVYFEKYSEARLSHVDFDEPISFSFAQILQATSFPIQDAVKDLSRQALALPPEQNKSRGKKASRVNKLTEASLRILANNPGHWVPPKNRPTSSSSLDMEIEDRESKGDIGDQNSLAVDSFSPRNTVGRDDPEDQRWKPDEDYVLEGVGTWVKVGESETGTPSQLDTLES